MTRRPCSIPGCTLPIRARALCNFHYLESLGVAPAPVRTPHRWGALDHRLEVLVSDDLHGRVLAAAGGAGVSAGEWVRQAMEGRLQEESMSVHETILMSLDGAAARLNAAVGDAKANRNDAALIASIEVQKVHNVILRTLVRAWQGDPKAIAELSEEGADATR